MMDLKIDQAGKLAFNNGRLQFVTGPDLVRQRLHFRHRLIRGEWPFDTREGVDYFGTIFVATPDLVVIGSELTELIRTTEGVRAILDFTLDFDPTTELLSEFFRVLTDEEEVLEIEAAASQAAEFLILFGAPSLPVAG